MPPRRIREWDHPLGSDAQIVVRWEAARDVVRFAVMLLVESEGAWRTVELFDCSHGDRNDRHRHDRDGTKGPAEIFHLGTPGEAMRDAIALIQTEYQRMIERWRA